MFSYVESYEKFYRKFYRKHIGLNVKLRLIGGVLECYLRIELIDQIKNLYSEGQKCILPYILKGNSGNFGSNVTVTRGREGNRVW